MSDLSPDARALLASLAVSHDPPPDAADRVRLRVAEQVAAPPAAGPRPWWRAALGLGVVAALVVAWSVSRSPAPAVAPPTPRVVVAPAPPPAPAPPVVPVIEAPPVAPTPAVVEAPRPAPTRPVERDDLAAELRLLQQAQTALSAHDTGAASVALRSHARAFPHGHLAEERDALAVQVLCARGQVEEARQAGAAFLARHPNSPQAARVRRTCVASP